MLEFQQFNMIWDKKMAEYESHAEELVEAMKERHAAELRDFQRKLLGKQIRPKFSKDLLNLRKIQETLAKQKDYAEAHKIKLKADALEAWELEKWHSDRQQVGVPGGAGCVLFSHCCYVVVIVVQDLLSKESKFKFGKQQELLALQKRIQTGREEQKKQRHLDLERLLQRYQNVKAELEAQQNLERIRMEKAVQSGGIGGGSMTGTRRPKSVVGGSHAS